MKISIITPTFNVADTLRHCLNSLYQQNIHFEHIVVDGGSTDASLDIIMEYNRQISKFISEPDLGIYDALNKGIRMAEGDICGILHADDFYPSQNVLQYVSDAFLDPSVNACYGDLLYVKQLNCGAYKKKYLKMNGDFKIVRYWKSGKYDEKKFYNGWMPPHPTFFVRRSVYDKYGLFSLDLGTAADYELMLRFLLKYKISCRYIPMLLVCMRTGGVSNVSLKNRLLANRMDRKAWEVNGLKPYPWTLYLKPFRKIPQYFLNPRIRSSGIGLDC